MTDIKTPSPSDAELIAELEAAGVAFMAFRGGLSGTKELWTTSGSQDAKKIARGMRAAIAKLGQPQAVAGGEPVAHQYLGCDGKWHDFIDALHYKNTVESGLWQIRPLYTAQPPQAVLEPLSDEQVREILIEAGYDDCDTPDPERAAFINGLRHGEAAHGITKGGQHG